MKRDVSAALLAVLCLSQTLRVSAEGNNTAPVAAKLAQGPHDGYRERDLYPPAEDKPYGDGPDKQGPPGGPHEDWKCPDPQPADTVKDVYLGHGTFSWRQLAAEAADKTDRRKVPAAPLNKGEALPARLRAHAAAKASSKGGVKASISSVTSSGLLLPTSLDGQDVGFPGAVDLSNYPPSEALAVGPHAIDDELLFAVHAINAQVEIFPTEKDGKFERSVTPTKVPLMDMADTTGLDLTDLGVSRVAAFYDEHKQRYVLAWSTYATGDNVAQAPPLFVAASLTSNPLGSWMIWALDLRPDVSQGVTCCDEQAASAFHLAQLQVSYSEEGLFIGATPTCVSAAGSAEPIRQELSALFVLSKDILCEPPHFDDPDRGIPHVHAAVYFAHRAWYRSVAQQELEMVEDDYEPFNSAIAPARPQSAEDADKPPLFAMKVSHSHLSVGTLVQDAPLSKMCSVETAPLIKAVVVGKGADFAEDDYLPDGDPLMPQPNTTQSLLVVGLGMPETHGGIVYWASQCNGMLYVTTGEYWGSNTTRVPSIYWAALKPTDNICHLTREDQGLVASQDGLALAYPVIAGRKSGGAVLAYSYSGADRMASNLYKAYPGVATTEVGKDYGEDTSGIDIVKRGPGSLVFAENTGIPKDGILPWGYNSAAHVCGDSMWFAVPIPVDVKPDIEGDVPALWYGSWISVTDL